jgi:transposase
MSTSKYSPEFKEQAVRLAMQGDKPVKAVAADLGLSTNMLHRWVREFDQFNQNGRPFPGHGRPHDEEMATLRKALRQAEMERDILKHILSLSSTFSAA